MSHKKLSKQNLSAAQKCWNEAISEAENQIGEHLRRVRGLKVAIKTLKELRDQDVALPEVEAHETGAVN